MKKYLILFLLALFCLNYSYSRVFTDEDLSMISEMLFRADESIDSLNFLKDWGTATSFKTRAIIDAINKPLTFPILANTLKEKIMDSENHILTGYLADIIWDLNDDDALFYKNQLEYFNSFFNKTINTASNTDIFTYIEKVFDKSDYHRRSAFSELNIKDKDKLFYLSKTLWSDQKDAEDLSEYISPADIQAFRELELDNYTEIIDKIDWQELKLMALTFYAGYETLHKKLNYFDFSNESPVIRDTKYGRFAIASIHDDVHTDEYSFLLDPSGDDIYLSDIVTDFKRPFYLIIDLGGDDLWRNKKAGSMASVIGGMGLSATYGGSDLYIGGDMAFSSFFGIQHHIDHEGDDIYRTGKYSLGAGTFGISVLENYEGNNIYHSTAYCQGFGSTKGVGLLFDRSGHDLYYSGGKYFHSPLRPHDFLTMSQGFGFGLRSDWAGGMGILFDGDGNDTYQGGVYSQGTAYWYSLGIHIDMGGNDTYNAVQYAQGSGIHLAAGFLYNREGDDRYFSRFGPGQGAGHDYSAGIFIDGAGDDFYSIDGGNGMGITNSVGIFIDRQGNDHYERNSSTNYGYANQARHSGSIGIFIDRDGDDVYPESKGFGNNDFWIKGYLGLGMDTSIPHTIKDESSVLIFDKAEIDKLSSVEEIFSIASEWEVGNNIDRVRYARERLNQMPYETAEYIFSCKLRNPGGLEYRAIEYFIRNNRDLSLQHLVKTVKSKDEHIVKTSLALLAELEYPGLISVAEPLLEKEEYISAVLSLLGSIRTDSASQILQRYIHDDSERIRVITARSLKNQNTEKSREILLSLKEDPSFLVRSLVLSLISD